MKKLLLFVLIVFSVSSCSLRGEVCDIKGEVFLALQENPHNFFIKLEDEIDGSIFEAPSGNIYPIDSFSQNSLFVITNDEYGPSASRLGNTGYYYSLTNEEPNLSEEYIIAYMGENIWCYRENN